MASMGDHDQRAADGHQPPTIQPSTDASNNQLCAQDEEKRLRLGSTKYAAFQALKEVRRLGGWAVGEGGGGVGVGGGAAC